MIGSDPEFCITYNGLFVRADMLFGGIDLLGEIGTDGAASTGELRPLPGENWKEAGDNICGTVRRMIDMYPGYEFWAGACYGDRSLGGHIHIDRERTTTLVCKLDLAISYPMAVLCRDYEMMDRGMYAAWSSVRSKTYGIEYRTPPSWILAPEIVYAVMAITESAVEIDINDNKLLTTHSIACTAHNLVLPAPPSKAVAKVIKALWEKAFDECPGPVQYLWDSFNRGRSWRSNEPINSRWN